MQTLDDPKARIRRALLRRRTAVPAEERARLAAAVCGRILGLGAYRRASSIAAYRPIGAELDPSGVAQAALSSGKHLYYPHVVDGGVTFVEAASGAGGFAGEAASSIVLVPGVAFDPTGVRLGRGGGHYDRGLAAHADALRIGIAAELQLVETLPQDPWDAMMDFIVTEARVLAVSERARETLEEIDS